MSSPLSTLGKNRRVPLPGHLDQTGGRKLPFKENPLTEYKAVLSETSGADVSHVQATEKSATCRSKETQRKGNRSRAAPTDLELMSSMMQRLTFLETQVKTQARDIERKERKICVLEEKVVLLQKSRDRTSVWRTEGDDGLVVKDDDLARKDDDLVRKCHRLQAQVWDMERFLSDYGLIWVGDGENQDPPRQQEAGEDQRSEERGEERETRQPEGTNFLVNFDLVLRRVRELNLLAGEGELCVRATPRGAELAPKASVPLRLYGNGVVMFDGPFRSYQEPSTQRCIQDLMDGYFPSELQGRFPDGVLIEVHDRREEEFVERRPWAEFPGRGQAVVDQSGRVHSTLSQTPGRKLSLDQFLSRLPKVVVKAGRVIDIRDSVKASLQGSSDVPGNAVTLIDTPVLQTMKERLQVRESERPASARDVATLRVRSEDGERTYVLKMRFSETIGQLRRYLDNQRAAGLPGYDIVSAFPPRCYGDDGQTLQSSGLTPNAALLLRTRPRPQT